MLKLYMRNVEAGQLITKCGIVLFINNCYDCVLGLFYMSVYTVIYCCEFQLWHKLCPLGTSRKH